MRRPNNNRVIRRLAEAVLFSTFLLSLKHDEHNSIITGAFAFSESVAWKSRTTSTKPNLWHSHFLQRKSYTSLFTTGSTENDDKDTKRNEKLVDSMKQSARPISADPIDETSSEEKGPKIKVEEPSNVFTDLPFPTGEQPNGEEKKEDAAPQSYLEWSADREEPSDLIPVAPPLSFGKFLTMQEKRVPVTVCYTEDSNLRPLYLTAAKRIIDAFPDVLVEKRILPKKDEYENPLFEILVDGKVIIGGRRDKKLHMQDAARSVIFVSMRELDGAVNKARRKRRPTTLYSTAGGGDGEVATDVTLKLQMARKNKRNHQKKE